MTSPSEAPARDAGFEPGTSQTESAAFLRGFLGSAVLLLIIRAAEPLFFGEDYFSTLTYHPFWIVVLLAAVQHGLFVGVATVGLATLMMGWPPRSVGVDITAYYADMAATPTQWLIVAVIIGLYRQGQIRRDQRVRRGNARLIEMNDALAKEIYRLDAALARAELAAATRPDGAAPASPGPALDALLHLSDPAADRNDAFIAAARACSDADIALLERSAAGDIVLTAATVPGLEASVPVAARELAAAIRGADPSLPAQVLTPDDRHALAVPIIMAGASEPVGAIVGFVDSPDELSALNSTLVHLARAVEASHVPVPSPRATAPATAGRLHA
ncbi:hypothetical protein H5395_06805 [Paracoccus sp. MC1854]|uniref:hypothetical protein n=1 Tax=Paracoccus sp. MC1854 TaxID=2760306 RepID=UPI0016000ACA|nr:hypothetical protein [Paracoccus sp. MC1854]MBB1491245.1 hypothetical protein [Paracoccus sp. MC1854]